MPVDLRSGKSIRYAYKRTHGAGIVDCVPELGRPGSPWTGRVVTFGWEINHPAIAAGDDVDWTDIASYASDPDIDMAGGTGVELISLLKWDDAFDVLAAFPKKALALLDAQVYVGPDVTTGAMAHNQTLINLNLWTDIDNTGTGMISRWGSTAWPALPTTPGEAPLVWTTSPANPPVLTTTNRRLWLGMGSSAAGSFNAGWIRIFVKAAEL